MYTTILSCFLSCILSCFLLIFFYYNLKLTFCYLSYKWHTGFLSCIVYNIESFSDFLSCRYLILFVALWFIILFMIFILFFCFV